MEDLLISLAVCWKGTRAPVSVPVTLFRLTYIRRRHGMVVVFIYNLMRIGRWSELSVDRVCQVHEMMREVHAIETSGELGSAFGVSLMEVSQLWIQ